MTEDVDHALVDPLHDFAECVTIDTHGGRVKLLAELVDVGEVDEALGDLVGERAQLVLLSHE